MSESRRHKKTRYRVITDEVKYRRHQRKKLFRKIIKIAKITGIVAGLILCAILIWWVLDIFFGHAMTQ